MSSKQLLTAEEELKVNEFIIKCVRKNVALPTNLRLGNEVRYTVQELLYLNADTLVKIGKQIETAIGKHGGSAFESDSKLQMPAYSGIYAEEWVQFLLLIITSKKAEAKRVKALEELKNITEQLESLKTPEELKADLLKRKNELLEQEQQAAIAGLGAITTAI